MRRRRNSRKATRSHHLTVSFFISSNIAVELCIHIIYIYLVKKHSNKKSVKEKQDERIEADIAADVQKYMTLYTKHPRKDKKKEEERKVGQSRKFFFSLCGCFVFISVKFLSFFK